MNPVHQPSPIAGSARCCCPGAGGTGTQTEPRHHGVRDIAKYIYLYVQLIHPTQRGKGRLQPPALPSPSARGQPLNPPPSPSQCPQPCHRVLRQGLGRGADCSPATAAPALPVSRSSAKEALAPLCPTPCTPFLALVGGRRAMLVLPPKASPRGMHGSPPPSMKLPGPPPSLHPPLRIEPGAAWKEAEGQDSVLARTPQLQPPPEPTTGGPGTHRPPQNLTPPAPGQRAGLEISPKHPLLPP